MSMCCGAGDGGGAGACAGAFALGLTCRLGLGGAGGGSGAASGIDSRGSSSSKLTTWTLGLFLEPLGLPLLGLGDSSSGTST